MAKFSHNLDFVCYANKLSCLLIFKSIKKDVKGITSQILILQIILLLLTFTEWMINN